MSESSSTEGHTPHPTTEDDGWALERSSWQFHRSAFRILGQPLPFGEYGYLRRQIGSGEAELLRFGDQGGLYRVRLRDGTVLDVLASTAKRGKKAWHILMRAYSPRRAPRAVASPVPIAVEAVAAAPPAPPVAAPPAPPEPLRRASTLSLGPSARTAAEVLAARLQPKAPPPRLESVPALQKQTLKPAPKSAQTQKPPEKKPPQQKQRAQGRR
jgi:hypothetical protein